MSAPSAAIVRPPQRPLPYPAAARVPGALTLDGVCVHPVDVDALHAFIARVIASGERATVLHLNVHGANLAASRPWLRTCFHDAQLVYCDGDGIRLGLSLLHQRPPPKVTLNRWLWDLAGFCAVHDYSLYLLGSGPGVARRAAERLLARFPALRIAGYGDGYFEKDGPQNDLVLARIAQSRPDVLILGFGMPLQERWAIGNAERIAAHVTITGGAVFEYAAGDTPIAHAWIVRMHLEWLYRLLLEPTRLFGRYVVGNPRFLARVLTERWRRGRGTAT